MLPAIYRKYVYSQAALGDADPRRREIAYQD